MSESPNDFSFDLIQPSHATRLDVLLVSPSCLQPAQRDETLARLETFINTVTAPTAAIAFLFVETPRESHTDEGYSLDSFMDLQVLLSQHMPTWLPIIPVSDASCFMDQIKEHMESKAVSSSLRFHRVDPLAILPRLAGLRLQADQPDTDGILGVLFPSLRCLSEAVRTQEGMALLDAYFGREVSDKLARFLQQDLMME